MYNEDGAFVIYQGIPPETIFSRAKDYLLKLKGIFRSLPRDTVRKDSNLLDAIDAGIVLAGGESQYLASCTDAAIFNLGDKKRKPRGPGSDAEGDDDAVPVHWNIYTAKCLTKVERLSLETVA